LGIALWAALLPLSELPGLGLAATVTGLLALGAWLGLPSGERAPLRQCLGLRGGPTVLALLLAWISFSLAWAEDTGKAAGELWRWYVGVLVLLVVTTSLRRPRDIRLVIGGFVVGAATSVVIGLVYSGLGGGPATVDTLTSTEGRLKGGLGDPNVLAAAIAPAIVLAVALALLERPTFRRMLVIVGGILVVGLAATQSRGGFVATGAMFASALIVMKNQRGWILKAALGVLLIGTIYFSAYPSGLHRISTSDSGSGRTDIWQVAWRISSQHPIAGVGLHNFTVYSPRYVRQPGALKYVDLIAERPHVVHNTYLEVLTETGIVGLSLFLAVIGASLATAWRAAIHFERRGSHAMGTFARAVLVAITGMLAAAFFVTLGSRPIFWLLLAFGPILLALAAGKDSFLRPSSTEVVIDPR
jgi:O-antigen ligase